MNEEKIIMYAQSFLRSEIRQITKLLENEKVSDTEKPILIKLLKEYKHDFEKLEEIE